MQWMSGYQQERPQRLPNNRRIVMAVCCPECQGLNIRKDTTRGIKSHWRCQDCNAYWGEHKNVGAQRCRVE